MTKDEILKYLNHMLSYTGGEEGDALSVAIWIVSKMPSNHEDFNTVDCKFCGCPTSSGTAHSHQGEWVGECCWDERLRTTE